MKQLQLPVLTRVDGFKAYDLRALVPDQLNADIAYRVGLAFAQWGGLKRVVVGRDIRPSSSMLFDALADGLLAAGVEVFDIGECGSEQVYFATARYHFDAGVMITASHNPIRYNGMKFVGAGGAPIGLASGLADIKALAMKGAFQVVANPSRVQQLDCMDAYIAHLLSLVDITTIKPLHVWADTGHGGAGPVLERLFEHLPATLHSATLTPDASYPRGVPNPMLAEQRQQTSRDMAAVGVDIGMSWDGDFDRCFFFDERGRFIDPYYVVGLLSEAYLAVHPGETIVHDVRLAWHSEQAIAAAGGVSYPSASGHAFMKQAMRDSGAIYGGETTGHHYFRDFFCCDSGILPCLLMLVLLSRRGQPLSALVEASQSAFPCSGEINLPVRGDSRELLQLVEQHFAGAARHIDALDGLSVVFDEWRFNLRASNTEPLLRLNIESRGDRFLVAEKRDELLQLIARLESEC
ncbi:MAG TPA: phosphomannomutase/phosphoglucomutase [Pseudomonadales bacterium]|nr:phosphomannomutase/phosphoglucomutase [Pseudomonadales bacterium]